MDQEVSQRAYELAFHLTPDMEESAVPTRVADVSAIVTQHGGSVSVSNEAKRIHLSYPIKRKHYAYFGVIDFQADPQTLTAIDAQMKLQDGLLRFMITSKPDLKEVRSLGDKMKRAKVHVAPTHKAAAGEGVKAQKAPAAPGEEKQIEKELEDVLGKI
jgi:small subunit ribosomal protein S6